MPGSPPGLPHNAPRAAEQRRSTGVAITDAESDRGDTAAAATQFRPFRTGFFGGLGLILAYVTYLALDSVRSTLILIAVATVVAIGLEPAVGFFIRRGFRRGWSVATVFLILLGVLGGAGYTIVPPIVTQLGDFIQTIPQILNELQKNATINNLDKKFHILDQIKSSGVLQKVGTGAATSLINVGVFVAGILLDLVIILILTLFFLGGLPNIKAAGYRLAPASKRARVGELGDKILTQMGGYLSGATLVAIQAGIVAGVFSAIVGLPYPWAIALGAALLDFVPVVGPVLIGVSMMLIGFTQSLLIGLIAAAFYLVQHMFEAYFLYPRVMRRQVDISTATVVVAILIGGALLGVTGALLAVPIATAIQLIVREVAVPIQDRS
ncbi:MAG: AI-2E family transporter [Antricoccus sp.]